MKPEPRDVKLTILITGDELYELKRFTIDMVEAFGLDRRIEAYSGKRPISFYRWDLDCLSAVIDNALKDRRAYPDRASSGYAALKRLKASWTPNTEKSGDDIDLSETVLMLRFGSYAVALHVSHVTVCTA